MPQSRNNSFASRYLVLVFIILVAVFLRLMYIDRPMRLDESMNFVEYISQDLLTTVTRYHSPNNHVFHTLVTQIIYKVAGNHPILLRLPALIAGILIVPLTYIVGTRQYNHGTGIFAAATVAIASPLVDFSVNARGYTIQTMLVLVLILLAQQLTTKSQTRLWVVYGIVSALGFYTIPTMLYPMGIIALWLLMMIWLKRNELDFASYFRAFIITHILAAGLTLLLYAPIVIVSGFDSISSNRFVTSQSLETYLSAPLRPFRTIHPILWLDQPQIVTAIFVLSAIFAVVRHRAISKDSVPIILPIILWLVFILPIQRVVPFHRTWIFLIPICNIIIGAGIYILWKLLSRWLRLPQMIYYVLVVLFTVGMAIYLVDNQFITKSRFTGLANDAEEAVLYLDESRDSDDITITQFTTLMPVLYYMEFHDLEFPVLSASEFDPAESSEQRTLFFYHSQNELDLLSRQFPAIDLQDTLIEFPESRIINVSFE